MGRLGMQIAALFVGLSWFVTQLFNELGAIASVQSGGVAYMAHIGGFLFGMATCRIFDKYLPRSDDCREP